MAKFDIAAILDGAQKALDAVQVLAPIAAQLSGPGVAGVATIAISAAGILENVLERGKGVKDAMSEQDEGKLRAMLSEIQRANADLAGRIATS